MSHSGIQDSASDADAEAHVNDEIPTISDATAADRVINKFFSVQTVEEKMLESFDVLDKEIRNMFLKSASLQQKITDYLCIKTVSNK